jgi:hypothetical protein
VVIPSALSATRKKRRRSKGGRGTLGSGKAVSHSLSAPEVIPEVSPPRLTSRVLAFSNDMAREELNLRRALLVTVIGTRPEVLGSEVLEVAHCFNIKLEDMTIQSAMPEDFLLFFPNEETAMRVLNGGKVLRGPRFSLVFKRWSRFSHASSSIMSNLVEVEIIGIPVHAWCRSTAEFILGDSCIIEEVLPDTLLQKTLPSFVARAWCFQPKQLHYDMILHILELGPQSSERRCLAYNISVRVLAICHDDLRGSSLLTPPEDGDQFDGSDDMDDQRNDEPRRLGSPLP